MLSLSLLLVGIRIVGDLLDHAHNTASSRIFLVLLEAREKRASWLLLLKENPSFFSYKPLKMLSAAAGDSRRHAAKAQKRNCG